MLLKVSPNLVQGGKWPILLELGTENNNRTDSDFNRMTPTKKREDIQDRNLFL